MSKSSLQIALLYTVTFISDKVYYTTPRYPDAHVGADPSGGYDDSVAAEAIENAQAFLSLAQREVQP